MLENTCLMTLIRYWLRIHIIVYVMLQLDLTEHWCFCATDFCNQESCFSLPFGSREFGGSYIAKRLQYSSYSNWKGRNDAYYWSTAIPLVFISSLMTLWYASNVVINYFPLLPGGSSSHSRIYYSIKGLYKWSIGKWRMKRGEERE